MEAHHDTPPAVTTIEREGVTTQLLTSEALAVLREPVPGPGARISRTGGQVGSALVFVELWQAFGWFGAEGWTPEQAAQRWPAVTAAVSFTIAAVHNIVNWWVARRRHQADTAGR